MHDWVKHHLIALDGTVLGIQGSGGISRYVAELSRSLSALEVDFFTFCGLSMNAYFDQIPRDKRIGFSSSKNWPGRGSLFRIVNKSGWRLMRSRGSVTHSTYYYSPRGKAPHVQTVYDCIDELNEQFFESRLGQWKRKSIEDADAIICISEHTRQEVLRNYRVDPSSTHVIYLGIPTSSEQLPGNYAGYSLNKEENEFHLLFVGNRSGYKNFDSLLEAIASPLMDQQATVLHLVGGGPLTFEERKRIAKSELAIDSVRYEGDLDPIASGWYQRVNALVYPSLHEGFGLPPLEALANGCPVIAADIPVLREILGNAASFFDVQQPCSLPQALLEAQREPKHAQWQNLPRSYSWENCARQTLEVYQTLL